MFLAYVRITIVIKHFNTSEHLLTRKQRTHVVLTSLQLNRIESQELFPE